MINFYVVKLEPAMSEASSSRWMLVVGVVLSTLVAVLAAIVVPEMAAMYESFGAELPIETRLLLGTYRWYGLLGFVVLGLGLWWPRASDRGVLAMVVGVGGSVLLVIFSVWSLYRPIFMLAAIGESGG